MTLTVALPTRTLMLEGIETSVLTGGGTANITLYQTNLALCVFPLAADPFGAAVSSGIALASVPISSTGTEVAGNANRFVMVDEAGTTVLTGTVSAIGGGGDIETPSVAVTAAATQTLNSFVLRMASNGALTVEASLTLV
jgi:hypothetical protein